MITFKDFAKELLNGEQALDIVAALLKTCL